MGKNFTRYYGVDSIWNEKIRESLRTIPSTSITIGENTTIRKIIVSNGIESIENGAFSGTVNLTELILPTTLVYLHGFQFCTNLKTINIPSSVTNIGDKAFVGSGLTDIIIPENVETMGDRVFGYTSATVHVFWKQGAKPEWWSDNWDGEYEGKGKPTVIYAEE